MKTDKLLHVLCGFVIAYCVSDYVEPVTAWFVGIGFVFGKEVYDQLSGKGTPERADLIWGAIGVLVGVVLEIISRLI